MQVSQYVYCVYIYMSFIKISEALHLEPNTAARMLFVKGSLHGISRFK